MALKSADIVILVLYSALVILVGAFVSRGKKNALDFFLASKKIPGWAIGISILGTCISSVTYVAYPGMAFANDWQYLVQGLTLPLLIAVGLLAVVPFYRNYVRMSVTEYMEKRFSRSVRVYTFLVIIIFELVRLATIMYLVSLVMSTITGINIAYVILVMGGISIAYTVLGGMAGVIWTDVVQTILFLLGGLLAIFIAVSNVDGGFSAMLTIAYNDGKFKLFDFTPDFTRASFYVLFLSGLVNFFYFFAGNQNQVQRYLCAKNDREAKNAALLGGLCSVPIWMLFLFVGSCLYVFFKQHPDPAISQFLEENKPDKVFPYFIATRLPAGISGLVLAALFSAAMSTLDSSITTISTLTVSDIYQVYFHSSERQSLVVSRLLTFLWGILGVILALAMIRVGTFLEFYFRIFSILGGSITGVFLLALFIKRANNAGAWAGIIAGLLVTIWGSLSYMKIEFPQMKFMLFPFDAMMVGVIATAMVAIVGYLMSFIFPSSRPSSVPLLLETRRIPGNRSRG